jgi:hypothetical protein
MFKAKREKKVRDEWDGKSERKEKKKSAIKIEGKIYIYNKVYFIL